MHFKSSWFRDKTWIILLWCGLSLVPIRAAAHHEVGEAQKAVEKSLRETFEAFNRGNMTAFLDGWTDLGFLNKTMFAMAVKNPVVPKDEVPIFFGAMKLTGPVQSLNISNIKILDHMLITATAEIEFIQGNVRERYELKLAKRPALDKRYKIAQDKRLPLYPNGFPVVDVKMTEYAFEFDKSRLARNMVLKLVNAGRTAHEFVLFKKMPGDWEDSVARGAWYFEPGQTIDLALTGLEPGEYAMVCCLIDPDNKPHCDKGMRTEFTLK